MINLSAPAHIAPLTVKRGQDFTYTIFDNTSYARKEYRVEVEIENLPDGVCDGLLLGYFPSVRDAVEAIDQHFRMVVNQGLLPDIAEFLINRPKSRYSNEPRLRRWQVFSNDTRNYLPPHADKFVRGFWVTWQMMKEAGAPKNY